MSYEIMKKVQGIFNTKNMQVAYMKGAVGGFVFGGKARSILTNGLQKHFMFLIFLSSTTFPSLLQPKKKRPHIIYLSRIKWIFARPLFWGKTSLTNL